MWFHWTAIEIASTRVSIWQEFSPLSNCLNIFNFTFLVGLWILVYVSPITQSYQTLSLKGIDTCVKYIIETRGGKWYPLSKLFVWQLWTMGITVSMKSQQSYTHLTCEELHALHQEEEINFNLASQNMPKAHWHHLVRNTDNWVPSWTSWTQICILSRSPVIHVHNTVWPRRYLPPSHSMNVCSRVSMRWVSLTCNSLGGSQVSHASHLTEWGSGV